MSVTLQELQERFDVVPELILEACPEYTDETLETLKYRLEVLFRHRWTKSDGELLYHRIIDPQQLKALLGDIEVFSAGVPPFRDDLGASLMLYFILSASQKDTPTEHADVFLEQLKKLLKIYPDPRPTENLLHYAVWSGSVKVIKYFFEAYPDLKSGIDRMGCNIGYYAILSRSTTVIQYILKECPTLKNSGDRAGRSVVHYAVCLGSVEVINYVLTYPGLRTQVDRQGRTVLYYAIMFGPENTLMKVLRICFDLLVKVDKDGLNGLAYLAQKGSVAGIRLVLSDDPRLAVSCWRQARKGLTLDALAPPSMSPKPSQILRATLVSALSSLEAGRATDQELQLVNGFHEECASILRSEPCRHLADSLIAQHAAQLHDKRLSPQFIVQIESLRSYIWLASINTEGEALTPRLLTRLCSAARVILSIQERGNAKFFKPESTSIFVNQLMKLAAILETKTTQQDGGEVIGQASEQDQRDFIKVLELFIKDSERARCSPAESLLRRKLIETKTIADLRPRPKPAEELNIGEDNFLLHFQKMVGHFKSIKASLQSDTQDTMENVILRGLQHLFTHTEKIVAHALSPSAELYYLDLGGPESEVFKASAEGVVPEGKLPMHTDHVQIQAGSEAEVAYRKLLVLLKKDLLGAFYVYGAAGRLESFYDLLSSGFCLEGRIRDTFTCAVRFTGLSTIHEFIQKRMVEYGSYARLWLNQKDTEVATASLDDVLDFIVGRYQGDLCLPDDTYAPDGDITQEGIQHYLQDVLQLQPKGARRITVV